jgi:hypothetical protein
VEEVPDASPFAAFAMPKRSAVEVFQEKQRQAKIVRRKMLGCILGAVVGATGGASVCAAYEADLTSALIAVVGALVGSHLGVVIGAIIGAMCFSVMVMTGTRKDPSFESNLVRRDPMTAMRGLMFAWALIGAALGAASGAVAAMDWAGVPREQLPLRRWTMVGAILGGAFGVAVWAYTSRVRREQSIPMEQGGQP